MNKAIEEKLTWTLKGKLKKTHRKKWLKIPTRRRKIWSRNWRNKLRRRRNVVDKSQSQSEKLDAIDARLCAAVTRPTNSNCIGCVWQTDSGTDRQTDRRTDTTLERRAVNIDGTVDKHRCFILVMPRFFDISLRRSAQCCNNRAQAIRHIRHLLTTELAQTLACSLILSRIDYCNAVLHGAPSYSIKKLQRVQNNAARIVLEALRRFHAEREPITGVWGGSLPEAENLLASGCATGAANLPHF